MTNPRRPWAFCLALLAIATMGCDSQNGDPSPEDSTSRVEQVSFSSGSLTLQGTLSIPETPQPPPAVVIVNGSGPVDRDGAFVPNPSQQPLFYKSWAARLVSEDVAVLRYDKRFLTHTSIDPLALTQEDQVEDILAAIAYLELRPEIDANRIFLVGHSEGGNLAPVAAQRAATIQGVVVVASVAFAIDTLVVEQLRANPANPASLVTQVEQAFALLRTDQFPAGGQILGAGEQYWREWIDFSENAGPNVLALDKPTLIVQGLADEIFPGATLSRNVALWQAVAAQSGLVELQRHAAVTHMLFTAGTEEVADGVVEGIAGWILQQ